MSKRKPEHLAKTLSCYKTPRVDEDDGLTETKNTKSDVQRMGVLEEKILNLEEKLTALERKIIEKDERYEYEPKHFFNLYIS